MHTRAHTHTRTSNTQLTEEPPLCCCWQYVVGNNEGNNKLHSRNYICVEIPQHHGSLVCLWGRRESSQQNLGCHPELIAHSNHLRPAGDRERNGNNGTLYTSEELTSSGGLWCSPWQARGEGGSWIQSPTQKNQSLSSMWLGFWTWNRLCRCLPGNLAQMNTKTAAQLEANTESQVLRDQTRRLCLISIITRINLGTKAVLVNISAKSMVYFAKRT